MQAEIEAAFASPPPSQRSKPSSIGPIPPLRSDGSSDDLIRIPKSRSQRRASMGPIPSSTEESSPRESPRSSSPITKPGRRSTAATSEEVSGSPPVVSAADFLRQSRAANSLKRDSSLPDVHTLSSAPSFKLPDDKPSEDEAKPATVTSTTAQEHVSPEDEVRSPSDVSPVVSGPKSPLCYRSST
jgi:hypothetical protein